MEVEFGGTPMRFLSMKNVVAYDSDCNEIDIPKCKNCDVYMAHLIGLTHCAWSCNMCGYISEASKFE